EGDELDGQRGSATTRRPSREEGLDAGAGEGVGAGIDDPVLLDPGRAVVGGAEEAEVVLYDPVQSGVVVVEDQRDVEAGVRRGCDVVEAEDALVPLARLRDVAARDGGFTEVCVARDLDAEAGHVDR